ncbi:MAG: thermonuclease family protein [Propionibacteriaceae bacterium]|nr:thermonuclease family protein [Propionibacteriaceae bacterium]
MGIGQGLAAGLVLTLGVVGVATAVQHVGNSNAKAEVIRVVDGDTLDVRLKGEETRVRLLNVDAPETKHPNKPVECLGLEASRFLSARLPAGSMVELALDKVERDGYGRLLAGVFESDRLVNAEIAAAGLGAPVKFDGNVRFYQEVADAAASAQEQEVGAHSPTEECALPGQVAATLATLATATEATTPAAEGAAELQGQIDTLDAALISAVALRTMLAKPGGLDVFGGLYSEAHRIANHSAVDVAVKAAQKHQASRVDKRNRVQEREAAERVRAEEQRLAKERAEREQRERAEREQRERDEQARREAESKTRAQAPAAPRATAPARATRTQAPAPRTQAPAPRTKAPAAPRTQAPAAPKPPAPAAPRTQAPAAPKTQVPARTQAPANPPNYNGPRCYAPGGKTWRPC